MAAPATPANQLPASLPQAQAMSTVGIELDLISPFYSGLGTYGADLERLYPSPYQSPRWITYWRGAWTHMCRRLETKTKNQLMCDMMALFTGITQERDVRQIPGNVHRLPDFLVESDLSASHGMGGHALINTPMALAIKSWRQVDRGDPFALEALALEIYSPLPQPGAPNIRATRQVSPHGMTIRPLLDNIVCPSLAIAVTNSSRGNGFITNEPHFGPIRNTRQRRSQVGMTPSGTAGPSIAEMMSSRTAGPSIAPPGAKFLPSILSRPFSKASDKSAASRFRQEARPVTVLVPLRSSIAYIHASEIEGQVDEAVAERALSTAVLQVLTAWEACGTFIASASFHTRWLRMLALNERHIIMETVNPEEAFQTVKFADMLRQGQVVERFAWDLRDLGTLDAPEPDMETIEQVWLAMYTAFRIAAEWPLQGQIPRIARWGDRQQKWVRMAQIGQSARDAFARAERASDVENEVDQSIRSSIAEALGVDVSAAPSLPATYAPRTHADATDAILTGESAMGFHEWAQFFHSHPDLVALVDKLNITVTFVIPSYLDSLLIERIPGYRPRA